MTNNGGIQNVNCIKPLLIFLQYNFDLKYKILSLEEFENTLKETIKILQSDDFVWVSVGSVVYATAQLALQDSIKILFAGLGTEEIFAGYARHEIAMQSNNFEAYFEGLSDIVEDDLARKDNSQA